MIGVQRPGRPGLTLTCPGRCSAAFGPGTRIPSPVSYHIADETIGSPEFGPYVSAVGTSYRVLSYGSCQHPQVSEEPTSCAGTASRTTTVRVRLRYKPLVTLLATGTVLNLGPNYDSSVTMDAQNVVHTPDGDSADCDFAIQSVTGSRCRFRLDPGQVAVSTSDGGSYYRFAGYTGGPCAGQEIGAPYQHGCVFTLGDSDVTLHATVTPPPGASPTAPLDSNLPPPPGYRPPGGPLRSDFQTDPTSEALDQVLQNLFDLEYSKGSVPFQIFVSLVKGSGLTITGTAGAGRSADAAGAPLFTGRVRAADDELAPLTITLTRAGQRLFANAGRHSIRITATYAPPTGRPVSKTRSGRVRS